MKEKPILFSTEMIKAILSGRKTQTRRIINPQPIYHHGEGKYTSFSWKDGFFALYQYPENSLILEHCPYKLNQKLWVRETWRVGAWKQTGNNWDNYGLMAIDYKAGNFIRKEWLKAYDFDFFDKLVKQSIEEAKKANVKKDEYDYYVWNPGESPCRWRPSIFMPRWASRINLEIINIRIERIQDISEENANAEGIFFTDYGTNCFHPKPCPLPEYHKTHNLKNGWNWKNSKSDSECWGSAKFAFAALWNSINEKRGYGWDLNPWVWVIEFKKF